MNSPQKQNKDSVKDEDFWVNQYEYFADAIAGLGMAYALLKDLQGHARKQLDLLNKESED